MSSPGLYSLLMNNTPDASRGTASAMQNVVTALSQAAAAAFAGSLLTSYGYARVFIGTSLIAVAAAALLFVLLRPRAKMIAMPQYESA